MFDLSMFFEDGGLSIPSERSEVFTLGDAINSVESGADLQTSANKYYEHRMWVWFDLYLLWTSGSQESEMYPQPTLEDCSDEIYNHFRSIFKAQRAELVNNLKVTVDGMVFDGDEVSRSRMVTAIATAEDDNEVVRWSLADNTVESVTSLQLKKALRLSGKEMENIWFQS